MNGTKHTPGPWRTCGLNVASDGERVVASCHADSPDSVVIRPTNTEECMANAQLIAVAPDLLAACEAALPSLSAHEQTGCDCPDSEAARMLRAAITKAKGI